MALSESNLDNFPNDFDIIMPEGLIDASPNSKASKNSSVYHYSHSEDSENSDYLEQDSENMNSSSENISIKAHDLAKSQIKKIEDEMKKMHQKHCQLLKDMDSNYAAIEQETHQRYIEFINKWKDQLKVKIDQYRKIIESLNMEISELKDYNSNFQEKINKVASEKNSMMENFLKEIGEKDQAREIELAAYEKQIKAIQKEKKELQQKIDDLLLEKEQFNKSIEYERNENLELQNKLKHSKKIEKLLKKQIESIQNNYANDMSQATVESLLKKMEDNEIANENLINLKRKIEKTRKDKVNFKRQITQWMQEFEKINGRPCENSDKEQIKHLYTKYIETNKKHETLQKKLDSIKNDGTGKKIVLDERTPVPRKMRSKSPSSNLNISVDSVMSNPSRKTPRDESTYKEKAETLERENAQLRKEIRSKITINGRSANQTPTSVANNIISSATSIELQQLKADKDNLKAELARLHNIMRESKNDSFDPLLIETQHQLDTWKNKAAEIETALNTTQNVMEQYKQDYEKLINRITENQENDNAELSTLKSQLAYINSELMIYRDKVLHNGSQQDLDFMYEKKKLFDENTSLHYEIKTLKEQIETIEKESLNKIKELEAKNASTVKHIHEEMQKLRKENIKLKDSVKTIKEKSKEENKSLTDNNFQLEVKANGLIREIQDLKQIQSSKEQELKDSIRQRRLLHNQLEDLRGKIRVFCRVRPMNEDESRHSCTNIASISDEFSINIEAKPGLVKTHVYDTVFGPNATQEEVFEDIRRLIQSGVDGYNVCIFAYGQTGSGKTHTIQGYPGCPGITPRGIQELYSLIGNLPQGYTCTVSCYMVELYIQQLIDLLRPKSNEQGSSLTIKTDSKGMTYIPEVNLVTTHSAEELMEVYESGIKNRHICKTKMNDTSSRSHLIFCVIISVSNNESEIKSVGKISFVDLAGSEKVDKSEATTKGLKETIAINKSLSALGDVISALVNKVSHIPYRNNKLTMLMSDSIGGTSKTLMFVNISPASMNREETITSLHYGDRMKLITNEPIKNIESKEISRLKYEMNQINNIKEKYKNMLMQAGIITNTDEEENYEDF